MNMNDYKNAVSRLEIDPGLKEDIMKKCEPAEKRGFNKKKFVPVIAAAAVCCVSITAVFANEFMGIFKKDRNFEMAITDIEKPAMITEVTVGQDTSEIIPVYSAELKKWDGEKLKEIFADGSTVENVYCADDEYTPPSYGGFKYDNNSNLYFHDGNIYYKADNIPGNHDAMYGYPDPDIAEYNDIFNTDIQLTDNELKSVDKKKAVETADEIVKKLGIHVSAEKTVYALDKDTLIKSDLSRNENGERFFKHDESILDEWTEEQEAYMIIYNVEYEGMAAGKKGMYHLHNYDANGWEASGSVVYAIVNKNGLHRFHADNIYETAGNNSTVEIHTAEEAADVICDYFDKNIPGFTTSINNCRLIYHAAVTKDNGEFDKEYEMRPYWEFKAVENVYWYSSYPEKEGFDYSSIYYIDAETLEMLTETGNY